MRFEAATSPSLVSNCAMHHGLGIGVEIIFSEKVYFLNNTLFDFVKYGISIETSANITIDGNWVIGIFSRHLMAQTLGDPMGAILGCANLNTDNCTDIKILNNIVSGVEAGGVDSTGYSVPAHECDDY
jgi:hypothetical protein